VFDANRCDFLNFLFLLVLQKQKMRAQIASLLASPSSLLTITGEVSASGVPALLASAAARGTRVAVLPGAFNPVHDGHVALAKRAAAAVAGEYLFELSVAHPTKGRLELDDVVRRVRHFQDRALPVVLTHCPLFADKVSFIYFSHSIYITEFSAYFMMN
jgi:hypothetical protein